MINYIYRDYPYGRSEAFVEYELKAAAQRDSTRICIYSLYDRVDLTRRYVPTGAEVVRVAEAANGLVRLVAALAMITPGAWQEIGYMTRARRHERWIRCLYRIYTYYLAAAALKRLVRKRPPRMGDVYASYWLNECAFAAVCLRKTYPDIRVTSRGHGFDVFPERCYMPFRREILGGLDHIYLINEAGVSCFRELYGGWLDMRKVTIAHLGVDVPETPGPIPIPAVFHVVTCSSLIPLKRLDLMIDALAGISYPSVHWTHIGGGPLEATLRMQAQEKLKETNVAWEFLGELTLEEVHAYYRTHGVHLFVNCSDTEGTPVAIMEAMSYGIPVVARDVGGNREIVDDTCGIRLPSLADARALCQALEQIAMMPSERYNELRNAARNRIVCDFSAEKNFSRYTGYLESVR
jgi:colanic acid/amylovoran biosynthesis glycosyltransferase